MSAKPYEVQNITVVASGPDFQVREFDVAPDEEVPKHYHTAMTDWCYCLEGTVAAEIDEPGSTAPRRLMLNVGESCRIEPGVAHRLSNRGSGRCRYLLVQAGGKYDFTKVSE